MRELRIWEGKRIPIVFYSKLQEAGLDQTVAAGNVPETD